MADRVIGYSDFKNALPEDIQQFIQCAHDQLWSFIPNPWRPRGGTLPPELFHKFSARNQCFSHSTNYQVAKQCIEKATEEKLYQEAVDVIFVVDRYAYWVGDSETPELLDKIQEIVDKCPEVVVAPQLILRKVRWLNDQGDYQSADQICFSVLSQAASCVDQEALVIGSWSFRTRRDFLQTVSAFLMLRGIIQMNLAQPVDAAVYLAASCQLTASETDDGTAIPQGVQVFTDVFLDMAFSEREELQSVVMFNNSELPLTKCLTDNASRILNTLPPGDVHFLKQTKRLTRIELQQMTESEGPFTTDNSRTLLHLLKSSIPENLEWAILQYQGIAHDFATSVFNIYLAFNHFGHSTEDILLLSKRLFMKSCGSNSKEDHSYFQQELTKMRVVLSDFLSSVETVTTENPERGSRFPVLRDSSPIDLLRDFKNSAMTPERLKISPLSNKNKDAEPCQAIVDPVATTRARSGLLPSNVQKFKPKLFQSEDSQPSNATSVDAEVPVDFVYRSLVKLPTMVMDAFSAPQKLHAINRKEEGAEAEKASNSVLESTTLSQVLQTKLTKDTVYRANVAKFTAQKINGCTRKHWFSFTRNSKA